MRVASFDDLNVLSQVGDSFVARGGGDVIKIDGILASSLGAEDFIHIWPVRDVTSVSRRVL